MNIYTAVSIKGKMICNVKKLLLTAVAVFTLMAGYATTYYSSTTVNGPNSPANWWTVNNNTGSHPLNFTTANDIFIVQSNQSMTAGWTVNGANSEIRISSGILAVQNGNLTCINITLNAGATLTHQAGRTIFCTGLFANNGGTYTTTVTSTVNFGTGGIIGGSAATTFGKITISTTLASDAVTVNTSPVTISATSASLTLTQGIFRIGSGNSLNFSSTTTVGIVVAAPGNFANSANGYTDADGGTINFASTGGSAVTLSGAGTPVFNNISSTGDGNWIFAITCTGSPRINGTLSIIHNSFQCTTSATQYPTWGSNSTLSVNNLANTYTPGSGTHKEWMAMASGTIGTTPGYPNNVVLMNMGTATGDGCGFQPTGTWSINGTLSIGNGTVAGLASLSSMTAFTCGGITIDNGSTLKHTAETFTVKGNWLQQGTTTGVFTVVSGTAPVIFGGSGTSVSPQTIGSTGSSTSISTINSITISNGTYVKLNCPVALPASGTLTLTSGILQTDATNILTVNNTATTGISGTGSASNCITGPVKWALLAAGTNSYVFPVAAGTATITYLPFTLSSKNTTGGNIATVQAFASTSGGSADGTTISAISTAEYWSFSTSSGLGTTGSTISVTRPTAVSPYDVLAKSTTAGGVYALLGGTAGTYDISGSNDIGTASPWFIVLASKAPVILLDHTGITQTTASNITQGITDNILSNFRVNVTSVNATLNTISFTVGGSFGINDITNFKLYTSTTASFPGGAALSTVAATTYVGGVSTVTFSTLAQACNVGNDKYFWITADVAATATINNTVIVPATPALSFTYGSVTNSITIGGTKTIIAPTPTVLINHTGMSQTTASNITQGTTDNILSNFRVNVTIANATLNTISFTIGGSFGLNDITNFKLYTSTTASFPGGAALSTVAATTFTGGTSTVTFSTLAQACNVGTDKYFWITADVASGATVSKTVIVPAAPTMTFAAGNITNSITIGGTKTIIAIVPVVTLDHSGIAQTTASSITQGSVNNILSNFRVNVTAANATLNTLTFTGTGNFAAGDLVNYKLYTSTTATFPGGAALSTVVATALTGTSSVSFTTLAQACNVGDRYFWITADVGTGAAAIGKTVQVPVTPTLSFTSATVTNNITVGGVKTISAGTPVILLNHTGLAQTTAGSIVISSTNNILSNFRVNVTTADATLNSLTFTIGGTCVTADLTNIKLYTSTTATFPGGAALSTATGYTGTGSTVTFSSLSQACVAGVDRYFWITADVAAGGVAGHTVIVPATPALSFAAGTVTNNITVGGTKTIVTYANYYNRTGGTLDASLPASWTTDINGGAGASPSNFTSGDKFTVRATTSMNIANSWSVSGGTATELIINGQITQQVDPFTLAGTFTNNGTFNNGNHTVTFGTNGSIGGTVATTFNNITINTTSNTDVVSLIKSGMTIQNGGTINITKGIFKVGTGNVINMGSNGSTNITVAGGTTGNFANALDGTGLNTDADGGTINQVPTAGSAITVTGAAVFYNITCGGGNNGNFKLNLSSTGVRINGTLTVGGTGNDGNQFQCNTNSPSWGPNSTLYMNVYTQEYIPGGTNHKEWMPMASGTIGTTAGYPNNVIIVSTNVSGTDNGGFSPSASAWSINGIFSVGDGTTGTVASIGGMTSFTCGGIIIDKSSTLKHKTETFTVKGNWTQQGSTTGVFTVVSGTTPVIFGGSGTSGSPQTINCTGSSTSITTINSITVSNGTYVKLNCPVTLPATGTFTLTSGIVQTDATNILSITNTATTGITGTGSSTNYINGPVKWTLANSSSNKYNFPVGKSTSYLPFDITPDNAQANNVLTVEAFNSNCGGSPDNITVNAISNTEYWSFSSSLTFTGSLTSVSAARTSGLDTFNIMAKSSTAAGTYASIGGSSGTVGGLTGITATSGIGSAPWFVVLAHGPLSITLNSVTYPGCNSSTGSITVSGSGGAPPYTYNINGGSYQGSGTFSGLAAGIYTVGVKDAYTTSTVVVELATLVITKDTGYCTGGSVQLQANGPAAWSYSWTPTAGLSDATIANPVANPGSTTTYTLSTIVVDNTTNLISNPGFESGNTGFGTGYIFDSYSALYGPYWSSWNPATLQNGSGGTAWGGQFHNGVYLDTSNANLLCSNLNSFGPRTGTKMHVVDGPNSATYSVSPYSVWNQTLTGLTTNTNYVFTFWVKNASGATPDPVLRTKINSTNVTGTTTYPNPYTVSNSSSWTQLSYLWNSGALTTAAIEIYDETVGDVGNDFALDDLSFYITCQPSKSVVVTVNTPPTLNTVVQATAACAGDGASINLTGLTSGTFTVNYTINGVAQTPVTGVISSSGNASFTTAVLSAANNGQTLSVTSLKNTSGNSNCTTTFTTKTVTLTVNQTGQWLGNTTDWNTASNWCGGIPLSTTNVLIPTGLTNYPLLSTGSIGTCNNITIQSGAGNPTVTVSGNTLQVYGTITSSGNFDLTAGTLELKGSTVAQTISGPYFYQNTIQNLKISNSSAANPRVNVSGASTDTLKITGAVSFGNVNDAVLNTGDLITLISTAAATARVADVTNAGANTGNILTNMVVVERYLPMQTPYSGRRWRLMGVPLSSNNSPSINEAWQEGATPTPTTTSATSTVSQYNPHPGYGTHITNGLGGSNNGNGFDAGSTANPSIYKMQAGTGNWTVPGSTDNYITDDNAYMLFVRGDRSIVVANQYINTTGGAKLRMKGNINVGNVTVPIVTGMQALSNPYPSAISFNNVNYKGVTPGVTAGSTYYMWDPKLLGSKNVGGFVTFSSTGFNTYTYVPYTTYPGGSAGISSFSNTGIIESGGAFMLQTTGAGNFIFHETDKISTSSTIGLASRPSLPRPAENASEFYTNLMYRDASDSVILADGVATTFSQDYHNEVDEQDAPTLQTFQTKEKISLIRDGKILAIERRADILLTDTIFLQMIKLDYNFKYQLQFYGKNFAPDLEAFLIDKYLKSVYPVKTNDVTFHNFETNAEINSIAIDRFKVVFRLRGGAPLPVKFISVKAWQPENENKITVEWNVAGEINTSRYEVERSVDGITFVKANTTVATGNTIYNWADMNPVVDGFTYYRIKSIANDGTTVYSQIVKVKMGKQVSGVAVYPNPVMNGVINLQMNNIPAGKYIIRLLNSTGQMMMTKRINHTEGTNVEIIKTDKTLAKGVYDLEIENGNMKYVIPVNY